MIRKIEDCIKLAEEILEKNQSLNLAENMNTREILLRYRLLAETLGKNEEIRWADQELNGYRNINDVPDYRKLLQNQSFNPDKVNGYILDSCKLIENKTKNDTLSSYYEYPGYKGKKLSGHKIIVKPEGHLEILILLLNEIHKKTTSILLELKYGKMENDIFEETRSTVNKRLHEICPEALNDLTQTYENLIQSEMPFKLQQIALSCRIVLKSFADSVYPPSNQSILGFDGKEHTLKDDEYINRILAYIQKNQSSDTDISFMKSYLPYLGEFLFNINTLANVGTHNKRSTEYAKRCVIYTYLVLGDVINLTEI